MENKVNRDKLLGFINITNSVLTQGSDKCVISSTNKKKIETIHWNVFYDMCCEFGSIIEDKHGCFKGTEMCRNRMKCSVMLTLK